MTLSPTEKLRKAFSKYDPLETLTTVAALSLHPGNAYRVLRLEACAEIASTLTRPRCGQRLRPSGLRELVRLLGRMAPEIIRAEDPFDGPLVEGAVVAGHSARLLPGLSPEDVFTMRKLGAALENDDLEAELQPVRRLLLGVAAISTEVAERGELPTACAPESPSADVSVEIPEKRSLKRLKSAVRLRDRDLASVCARFGTDLSSLEPVVQELGAREDPILSPEDGPLASKPIVRTGEWYVVAAPHCLLRAVFLHLESLDVGVRTNLARRFHEACRQWMVRFAPLFTDSRPSKLNSITGGDGWLFTAWGVTFDLDKVAYVALLTEAGDVEPSAERIATVLQRCLSDLQAGDKVLLLLLYQRLFRPFHLHRDLARTVAHRGLAFPLQDLEVLLYSGPTDAMHLWRFAGALDRLAATTRVNPLASTLDLYALYRDHRRTFYLGDDAPPTALFLRPCYASALRTEVARDRDRHGIRDLDDTRTIEVVTATAPSRQCFYVAPEEPAVAHWRIVKAGTDLWVTLASSSEFGSTLLDAVLFWLGELAPHVSEILGTSHAGEPITIEVHPPPAIETLAEEETGQSPYCEIRERRSIALHVPSVGCLAEGENTGEREMVRVLCRALFDVAQHEDQADTRVPSILETVAPRGSKKRIHVFVDIEDPEVDPKGLPAPRPLQREATGPLLDDLGHHLRIECGYSEGAVAPKAVNDGVANLVGNLTDRIAYLDPIGLLEHLVVSHEAIIRDTAWWERTLQSQLACAPDDESFVETATERLPLLWSTSVAGRFLVEYVTATPPSGGKTMTLDDFDELMAIAAAICDHGMYSDVIHHGLLDLSPKILPSGRLGLEHELLRGVYETAHARHVRSRAIEPRIRAVEPTRDRGKSRDLAWLDEVDPLMRGEFSYSLREFLQACAGMASISLKRSHAVERLPFNEAATYLARELSWSTDDARRVLSSAALRPRPSFWEPENFEKFQVYPWRFNRELSYLRRPFLIQEREDGECLVWGPRNASRAAKQLFTLVADGRLRASRGGELERCLSKIANGHHEEFNDTVADWFEGRGYVVRRRVDKIGGQKIANEQGELGDVDVLVADASRKTILLVECKGVHIALAPGDIASQLAALDAKLNNHLRRGRWVAAHVSDLLTDLKLSSNGWRVAVLAVTDGPLVSQAYKKLPVPVLALSEVQTDEAAAWGLAAAVA